MVRDVGVGEGQYLGWHEKWGTILVFRTDK